MKLYYAPGACSLAVHISLREAGIPFEAVKVDLATHKTADGADYHAVSPHGYVPLVEWDDSTRSTEVAAILQFVADMDPRRTLIGVENGVRRRTVIETLAYIASELHKLISPWLWSGDTAASTRAAILGRLRPRFAQLDGRLATSPWLAGEFSVADAYGFAVVNWSNYLAIPLAEYPNLQAWLARMSERPKVREAMVTEGLLKSM